MVNKNRLKKPMIFQFMKCILQKKIVSLIESFENIHKPIYSRISGSKGYYWLTNKKSHSSIIH